MDGLSLGNPRNQYRLSLVIPAYNEAAVIAQAIAEADDALSKLVDDYEILIVDDGSCDQTAQLVSEAAANRAHVRLLQHGHNRGYGAALRTGFEAARFELIAFTDADCQFDLSDLARLLPLAENHQIVAGYRIDRQDPTLRRFVSWGYNLVIRTLLGTAVRDCDCALKVFRKDCLAKLLPETPGFFVNTEMLTRARQLGSKVAEVGVRHRPRLSGESKVSFRDVPRTLKTLLPFWWSRVLFAGGEPTRARTNMAPFRSSAIMYGLLALMAGLLFFAHLSCPLLEPDEARYAEIPRQMLEQRNVIVPVIHGEPYYHKPPLLYWLVMACYSLFGVHDWAARLVPATAGVLTVLLTFWWGRRTLGDRAAFAGAIILCLSARFVYLGRMLTMDGLLCLFVTAALATAHVALGSGSVRRRWWLLSAVCCGLGILTKGPVALLLVLVPAAVYRTLDSPSGRVGARYWLAYAGITLVVAAPWYVLAALHDSSFPGYFLWTHNVVRFVAPYDHAKPLWFYLPDVLIGMTPWSLLVVPLALFLARRNQGAARRRPAALGFFLLSFLNCLIFFSVSGCKKAGYILPVFPPLALAFGCYLDAVLPHQLYLRRWPYYPARFGQDRLARAATILVLTLGCLGAMLAVFAGIWKIGQGLSVVGMSAVAFVWGVRHLRGRGAATSWTLCAATTFAFLLLAVHLMLPGYARKFSLRGEVRRHLPLATDTRLPVVCYPHRWDSVCFYLRRNDVGVWSPDRPRKMLKDLSNQTETLVFVKSDHHLDRHSNHCLTDLIQSLPPTHEFVARGRQGPVTAGIIRRRVQPPEYLLADK
jgi:dolichol-phosphate mannosyltransferase